MVAKYSICPLYGNFLKSIRCNSYFLYWWEVACISRLPAYELSLVIELEIRIHEFSSVVHLIHLYWRWNKTIVGQTLWPCIQSWSTELYPLKYFLIYTCRQLLSVPMLTFPYIETFWNQFLIQFCKRSN